MTHNYNVKFNRLFDDMLTESNTDEFEQNNDNSIDIERINELNMEINEYKFAITTLNKKLLQKDQLNIELQNKIKYLEHELYLTKKNEELNKNHILNTFENVITKLKHKRTNNHTQNTKRTLSRNSNIKHGYSNTYKYTDLNDLDNEINALKSELRTINMTNHAHFHHKIKSQNKTQKHNNKMFSNTHPQNNINYNSTNINRNHVNRHKNGIKKSRKISVLSDSFWNDESSSNNNDYIKQNKKHFQYKSKVSKQKFPKKSSNMNVWL